MVHLLPLPGSPQWAGNMDAVLDRARRDAEALATGGCDLLLVENMGDVPYLRGQVAPETVAAMSRAAAVVTEFGLPTGVQVLAAANREALGVAVAAGAHFIRAEGFAYAHVADEGWIDASAGPLLRARRALGASIEVWADIQKKHSAHATTADLTLADWAHGAVFCGADAVVVTGNATGMPTALSDVEAAATAGCPVVVGSGVDPTNVAGVGRVADAVIVGSWLKKDGGWRNAVDVDRVRRLREALDAL